MLYKYIYELIRESRSLNFTMVEVYTNGTRLTESLVQLLQECGVMLATSFYSDDACTHDEITGVRGSHARCVAALRLAVKAGIPTRVGVITMPSNEGSTPANINFLQELGIERIHVDHARGIGRGTAFVTPDDPMQQLCGSCWQGRLAINSVGDASPCVFSHFHKIGNVSEGLASLLSKPSLHSFRSDMYRGYHEPNRANELCSPGRCGPSSCGTSTCSPQDCSPIDCVPYH